MSRFLILLILESIDVLKDASGNSHLSALRANGERQSPPKSGAKARRKATYFRFLCRCAYAAKRLTYWAAEWNLCWRDYERTLYGYFRSGEKYACGHGRIVTVVLPIFMRTMAIKGIDWLTVRWGRTNCYRTTQASTVAMIS